MQEIDTIQISDEGIVALPQSVTTALRLQAGDEVMVETVGAKVVLHRLNQKRVGRSEPRPLGHGRGDFELPEGWEAPMTDQEADDFLNGR